MADDRQRGSGLVLKPMLASVGVILNTIYQTHMVDRRPRDLSRYHDASGQPKEAIADLLLLLHLPMTISKIYTSVFVFNRWLCHTDQSIKYIHLFVTLLMIVLIAVDRYVVIVNSRTD